MAALNASGRTVTLKGGPVTVKYTVDRLIEIEDRFGSLPAGGEAVDTRSASAGRFLLWIGTGKEVGTGAPITEDTVGPLMDGVPLRKILGVINDAIRDALSGDDDEEAGPTKEATAPTPGPTS